MQHCSDWESDIGRAIIEEHAGRPGALLPMLHALQAEFGCIPEPAVRMAAEALNLSRADVHGVVSFYHDFRAEPPGEHVMLVCRAEACQAMGGARLAQTLLDRLGIAWGETTIDGRLTVAPTYCLGLCACAPAALLDGEPAGRLRPGMLEALAEGVMHR